MKKSILFVAALAMTFAACQSNYDVEDKTVALRSRKEGDLGAMPLDAVIERIVRENADKVR